MKKLILAATFTAVLVSCGGKEEEKKKGFEYNRTKTETTTKDEVEVPVDMNNKGIGPITSLKFETINEDMVQKGKEVFNQKCTLCHFTDKKLIGPALKGVYERRSPEWVMNMMLNPIEMQQKDPIAKALQKANNNAVMSNQNLTEVEARAIAEYLRTL